MSKHKPLDRFFLGITITLISIGAIFFISASLGVFAKNADKFQNVLSSQLLFGLGGGLLTLYITSRIPYQFWKRWSLLIFILGLILLALVFVPSLGLYHAGARRWISIAGISFQPVEALKIGFILYFARWLVWMRGRDFSFVHLVVPLILSLVAVILLIKQPDTKNIILLIVTAMAMLFSSGVPLKKIGLISGIAVILFIILILSKPYLQDRIKTFINPATDLQGKSWQLDQSLLAVGSGGIFGRGLGQSVQKFSYLPEPQGDSIFAVLGEEAGFIGTTLVVVLYIMFALRGYRIARRAPDLYSSLLVVGVITIIISQTFLNIMALIGLFPLTGVPLVFMSHGGTSLLLSLASVGIVLSISRHQKNHIYHEKYDE